MKLELPILSPDELRPYVPELRAIEAAIRYPIADGQDEFTIDHGPDYHRFFSESGDQARFMIALDASRRRVLGSMAGVWRPAQLGASPLRTLYLGDLKLIPEARGRDIPMQMYWRGLVELFRRQELRGWQLVWGAAMRGAPGDVTRTMRGLHPGRIALTLSRQQLYFVPPSQLLALPDHPDAPPAPRGPCLDLSAQHSAAPRATIVSTRGKKDFQLRSTGAPWPLIHVLLGPAQLATGLPDALRRGASAASATEADAICCFGLDERLDAHISWLHQRGVEPGALCTVYGLAIDALLPQPLQVASWVHLATCDI